MNECDIKCPFVSGDNKYDVLINQLNREIEEIKKTTTAKSLLCENKLNELCVYIKNNLSNELRLLFDSMKVSGELETLITETIMQEVKQLTHKTDGYVSVTQFGAQGNGQCDDTKALQETIDYAFRNKKTVYIPNGVYKISHPLVVYGIDETDKEGGTTIVGASKSNCRIVKTTNNGLNLDYPNNCVFVLLNHRALTKTAGEDFRAYGINLSNFCVDGNNVADFGIDCVTATAECNFKDLEIRYCKDTGFMARHNTYLNLFERITISYCGKCGFNVGGKVNTSNQFLNCYVRGGEIGYNVSGSYCQLSNCCADGVSDVVYDLVNFRGTCTSIGSESVNANVVIKVGMYSDVTIISPYTLGNFDNENATHILCDNGSKCKIIGGYVLVDHTGTKRTAKGYLYKINGVSVDFSMSNCRYDNYAKRGTSEALSNKTMLENKVGSVNFRYGDLIPFVGVDTLDTNGYIDGQCDEKVSKGNAIYFGFGDSVNELNSGRNIGSMAINKKGDIILSQEPRKTGAIGWIEASDLANTTEWRNGDYLKIPVILSGTTDERPTQHVAGQHYFDETIGAEVVSNGGNWTYPFNRVNVTATATDGEVDSGLTQDCIILGVAQSNRSGYNYTWNYKNGSWKIKCTSIETGADATGEFTFAVFFINVNLFHTIEEING